MGFSIGKVFKSVAKVVTSIPKVVTNPAKLTTAVLTGGVSVVAPKLTAPLTKAVKSTLYNPQLAVQVAGLATGGVPALALSSLGGGTNMGLNIGGLISGGIAGIGTLLSGGSVGSALQNVSSFLPSYGAGTPTGAPTTQQAGGVYPTMSTLPAIGRAGVAVGRGFFNRFPNLAVAIQGFRNMGRKVTRGQLYSLLKRFGPDVLITGGILSAAAISELMVAGPGRRRMNPANVKALRRSLRRLESFHHLCVRVDKLRRPRSRKAGSRGGAQQFVRQG